MCTPATFSSLSLAGAEVLSLSAQLVTNYNTVVPGFLRFAAPAATLTDATFCNVTVTYRHQGEEDRVNVENWLPVEGWNGRLLAVGGGGFVAGRAELSYPAMGGAIAEGYATVSTDAGVSTTGDLSTWALDSSGQVDETNLENFASRSLVEQSIIGKAVAKSLYNKSPKYSYFAGCSQGGRQGFKLAQEYPKAYDGIIAAAPAINFSPNGLTIHWPQQAMNELGEYPPACEFEAIGAAAVTACDGLDGIVDGVITNVEQCRASFDPFSVVGKSVACAQKGGQQVLVSEAAAVVSNASWHGITTGDGKNLWFGFAPAADIGGMSPASLGVVAGAMTDCSSGTCVGLPVLAVDWIRYFLLKNPKADLTKLSRDQFVALLPQSQQEFGRLIDTDKTDLSAFRKAGGKIITYHGTLDQLITPGSTEKYFNAVAKGDAKINDFFRYYKAPGLGHCFGGPSGNPEALLGQLRAWREQGKAPAETPINITTPSGEVHNRILCPYPKEAVFNKACGKAGDAKCWSCK